jgi:hypothetical protein
VRQAVQQHGMKARVAEQDFDHTLRGRIFPENRIDLLSDGPEHTYL